MVITSDSAVPFRIAWPYLGRPGAQDQRERRRQSATASWAMSLGSKKPRDQGIIGIFHYSGLILGYSMKTKY